MRKALGLRWAAVAVVVTALLVVVAACGAAETEVVEVIKEVPVEKEVIKEVIVEKEVVVEKVVVKEVPVEKVVVREKEVVVVATPLPPGEAPWMINLASTETKFGGHLRHATHGPMSHFDIFASGSISNMGPQGPMYDSMLRVNPHHPLYTGRRRPGVQVGHIVRRHDIYIQYPGGGQVPRWHRPYLRGRFGVA